MKCFLGLKKPGLAVVCLALLTALGAFSASAQTRNGTIVGTVTDKSGAAVPKAKVTGNSSELGVVREFTTDSTGSYRLENLPPGSYAVTVEADGFSKFQVSNVAVKGSLEVTVNAHMEIGSLANTITVETGAAQELHTETAELGAEISNAEITSLPINSLNPVALVLTQAGVQDGNGFSFSNCVGFSLNGTRPRANNFLVDAQDNNDNSINGQAFQTTNLGPIQEATRLTNSSIAT